MAARPARPPRAALQKRGGPKGGPKGGPGRAEGRPGSGQRAAHRAALPPSPLCGMRGQLEIGPTGVIFAHFFCGGAYKMHFSGRPVALRRLPRLTIAPTPKTPPLTLPPTRFLRTFTYPTSCMAIAQPLPSRRQRQTARAARAELACPPLSV